MGIRLKELGSNILWNRTLNVYCQDGYGWLRLTIMSMDFLAYDVDIEEESPPRSTKNIAW